MMVSRKLFSFKGRLRRRDWWILSALILLVQVCANLAVIGLMSGIGAMSTTLVNVAILAIYLVLQWPSAALNVRRFHDRDRRGWPGALFVGVLAVLVVAPALAGTSLPDVIQREDPVGVAASALMLLWMPVTIWMFIVLALADGTPGPNRFGPSPKGPSAAPYPKVDFGPPDPA